VDRKADLKYTARSFGIVLEDADWYVKPTQPAKEAQNASAVATVYAPFADPPGTRSLPALRKPAKPAGAIAAEPGGHVARAHAASAARAARRRGGAAEAAMRFSGSLLRA